MGLFDNNPENPPNGGGAPPPSTPPPGGPAGPTETFAQKVRRIAAEQHWSEDFQRFSDAQIEAWKPSWDETKQRFRSEHAPAGANGDWVYVEKPTESVTDPSTGIEWGPWGDQVGVNVTEKKAQTAGGSSASGSTAPTWDGIYTSHADGSDALPGGPGGQYSDLQDSLLAKFMNREGMFGFGDSRNRSSGNASDTFAKSLSGGGLWWGTDKGMFDKGDTAPTGGGGGGEPPNYADWAAKQPATSNAPNAPAGSELTQTLQQKFLPPIPKTPKYLGGGMMGF